MRTGWVATLAAALGAGGPPMALPETETAGIDGAEARDMARDTAGWVSSVNSLGETAYGEAVGHWGTVHDNAETALTDAATAAKAKMAYTNSLVNSYKTIQAIGYTSIKNGPAVEKTRASALFKEDEKALKGNEDVWDAKLSAEERAFTKFISASSKTHSKFLKEAEKNLKALVKEKAAWKKATDKIVEKGGKEFEKHLRKEKNKYDKEREKFKEQTANEQAGQTELGQELEQFATELEKQIGALLEGQDGDGVGSALAYAETFDAGVHHRMDHSLEKFEASHVVELASMADELEEALVATLEEIEERGSEMDDGLENAAMDAKRELTKLRENQKIAGMKLVMDSKSQNRDLKKAQRSKGRIESALSTAADGVDKDLGRLVDDVRKNGEMVGDVLAKTLEQKVTLFQDSLRSVHNALAMKLEKRGGDIQNGAMVALAKLQGENDREASGAIADLERTLDSTDKSRVSAAADERTTDNIARLGLEVQKGLGGFAEESEAMEAGAAKALQQGESEAGHVAEKLSGIESSATTSLRKGLTEALAAASHGQTQLQEKVMDASKASQDSPPG
jgi:hypothetical protein